LVWPRGTCFSAEELARLRGFPEITRAELIRYFTLTGPDVAFLRKFHSRVNVLGAGVQLCSLPWLGFVPDEVTVAPAAAVGRLAERLDISAGELAGYGHRGQTRTGLKPLVTARETGSGAASALTWVIRSVPPAAHLTRETSARSTYLGNSG
jgi:Domain of unknown function (DUF4158)